MSVILSDFGQNNFGFHFNKVLATWLDILHAMKDVGLLLGMGCSNQMLHWHMHILTFVRIMCFFLHVVCEYVVMHFLFKKLQVKHLIRSIDRHDDGQDWTADTYSMSLVSLNGRLNGGRWLFKLSWPQQCCIGYRVGPGKEGGGLKINKLSLLSVLTMATQITKYSFPVNNRHGRQLPGGGVVLEGERHAESAAAAALSPAVASGSLVTVHVLILPDKHRLGPYRTTWIA